MFTKNKQSYRILEYTVFYLLSIVISYVIFHSLWFSIVQTQLHFMCMTGNFWKWVV